MWTKIGISTSIHLSEKFLALAMIILEKLSNIQIKILEEISLNESENQLHILDELPISLNNYNLNIEMAISDISS